MPNSRRPYPRSMQRASQRLQRSLKPYAHFKSQHGKQLSTSSSLQSGHNRWSTIKHDKGKSDAKKNKERSLIAKDVEYASRESGPDPHSNPRLASLIASANRAGFPKTSIEAAIARGQGKSATGATLESISIEAVLPPVAILVDCLTDSKARTLADLRHIIKQHGGSATPTKYLFEKRGRIVFLKREGTSLDDIFETALEAGALDITTDDEGRTIVDTDAANTKLAQEKLTQDEGLEVVSSNTTWIPNADTKIESVEHETWKELLRLNEELQSYPGVQQVCMNLDVERIANENEEL